LATSMSVIQEWNILRYVLMKRALYFVYIFDNVSGVITVIFTVMDIKRNWIYKLWRESVIWNFLEIGIAETKSYYTGIDCRKSFWIAYIILCGMISIFARLKIRTRNWQFCKIWEELITLKIISIIEREREREKERENCLRYCIFISKDINDINKKIKFLRKGKKLFFNLTKNYWLIK